MKRILAALAAGLTTLAFAFPFLPLGTTTNLAVTAAAQSLTLPTTTTAADAGKYSYVLTNIGTQTVFVRCDGVAATTAAAMPMLANSQILISLNSSVTACSAIAGSTGSTLYATVGSGQ